jgi:magnesium-protoporphyrin IX monomethyl ester (oxidative) cyclase
MTKVLLINMSSSLEKDLFSPDVVDLKFPIGLAYLAGELRLKGHCVRICDANALGYGITEIIKEVVEFKPDIVGTNLLSATKRAVYELMNLLKKLSDEGKLQQMLRCVGGPEATLNPYEPIKSCPGIDVAVCGEGETVLTSLAETLTPDRSVPGLCFRSNSDIVFTGKAPRLTNLDTLPYPAIDLLPLGRYFSHGKKLYVLATRGCPYGCTFCCSPKLWDRKVTKRSAENVIGEILGCYKKYGVKDFHFLDDDLLLWGDELKKFCEMCESLGFRWRFISRIDRLNNDLLEMVSKAGCYAITFGIETASQRIQKEISKNINLHLIPNVVSKCFSLGIRTKAYFMLGFPGETPREMQETIDYAIRLRDYGLTDISILPVFPYSGTKLFNVVKNNKCIENDSKKMGDSRMAYDSDEGDPLILNRLAKCTFYPTISCNEYLDGSSLRQLIRKAYRLFYKRTVSFEIARRIIGREIQELVEKSIIP